MIGLAALLCATTLCADEVSKPFTASDNPRHSALDRAVDTAATDYFHNRCHVGLSLVAVTRQGRFFYDYGATRPHGDTLPNRHSIYEIASVTKTFTGALAARAVEEGKMRVDTDFRPYLPGDYANLAWQDKPVTLATLITHRSGMQRDIPDSDAIFAKKDFNTLPDELIALQKGLNRDTLLSSLHDIHLRSAPGSTEAYSNVAYLVIGLGLEKVYGQPFETLMRQRLLTPLGMNATGFAVAGADRARLLQGFNREGRLMPYHLRNAGAAWGLYSTTEDMAKYVQWQLDAKDPVVQRIRQPLVGTAREGVAMPWNLAYEAGQPMLAHGGGSGGMSSQMVLFPAQDEGFALFANDTCEGTESALKTIAVAVHNATGAGHKSP
ncbi:serine hydrolase domain-containing protein [Dyella sp. 2RAB6]|uniref:serine hydrolase domain-containing protein n=1 Tax=Dyella sp. 2RAB6 TaxID=3232992 RepID=UPI003F8E7005